MDPLPEKKRALPSPWLDSGTSIQRGQRSKRSLNGLGVVLDAGNVRRSQNAHRYGIRRRHAPCESFNEGVSMRASQ